MKSPMPSPLDLRNLHYEISNLFTIKSPMPLPFDFLDLHYEISSLLTIKYPMPSPFDLQSLHYEISSLLTTKPPIHSPLHLQSLHYVLSKFLTTPSPVPILYHHVVLRHPNLCCSCNSRPTNLVISHSKHAGLRTVLSEVTQSSDETHVGLRLALTKADTPTMCVPDVSLGVETKMLLVYLPTPPAVLCSVRITS